MFANKSKKLKEIQQAIAGAEQENKKKQDLLSSLQAEKAKIEQEEASIANSIENERKLQKETRAKQKQILQDVTAAQSKTAEIKDQIKRSAARSQELAQAQGVILDELKGHEALLTSERATAKAAAADSKRVAESLQADEAVEQERLQALQEKHKKLKAEAAASAQQCEAERADRDEKKAAYAARCEEVQQARSKQKALEDTVKQLQKQVSEVQNQRRELEDEVKVLGDQNKKMRAAHAALEEEHHSQGTMLNTTSVDLSAKKAQLQRDLKACQEKFDGEKARQDQILSEHVHLRETLSKFLPDYFELQTTQAGKSRELENARRAGELLRWEHHKVVRDLQMLMKSYDVRMSSCFTEERTRA